MQKRYKQEKNSPVNLSKKYCKKKKFTKILSEENQNRYLFFYFFLRQNLQKKIFFFTKNYLKIQEKCTTDSVELLLIVQYLLITIFSNDKNQKRPKSRK